MRRTHLLTDDDGYLYTRYVQGRLDKHIGTVVGMRRRRQLAGP